MTWTNYSMKLKLILTLFFLFVFWMACQETRYMEGKRIYDAYCGSCHMEDGQGLRSLVPPLAKADYLANNQSLIPCIITKGLSGPIQVNGKEYDQPMAGITGLTNVQITNVINYINNAWGNDAGHTSLQEVERALEGCK